MKVEWSQALRDLFPRLSGEWFKPEALLALEVAA